MFDPGDTGVHESVVTLTGVHVFVPGEVAVQTLSPTATFCQSSPRIRPITVIEPDAEIAALATNSAVPVAVIDPVAAILATPAAV